MRETAPDEGVIEEMEGHGGGFSCAPGPRPCSTRPIPRGTSLVRRCALVLHFLVSCGNMPRMHARRPCHRQQRNVSKHTCAFPESRHKEPIFRL